MAAAAAPAPRQRVAVITGGAQGIGRAMSLAFLARGYAVAVADIDGEAGDEFVTKIVPDAQRSRVVFVKTDVSSEAAVKELFAVTKSKFGECVDAIVNNAAIANPTYTAGAHDTAPAAAAVADAKQQTAAAAKPHPLEQLSVDVWDRFMAVNVRSVMLTAKHGLPFLRAAAAACAKEGAATAGDTAAIVNIASSRAVQSEPFTEPYSATKGAVVALTHSLAMSLGGEKIRVNCVSPGWIDVTGLQKSTSKTTAAVLSAADHAQHPVGRVGVGADIAEFVLFLADGSKSGFVTGQNHVVDGGMTKKMIYV